MTLLKRIILTAIACSMVLCIACTPAGTDTTHHTSESAPNTEQTQAITTDITNDTSSYGTPSEDKSVTDTPTEDTEYSSNEETFTPVEDETQEQLPSADVIVSTSEPTEDTEYVTQLPDETQATENTTSSVTTKPSVTTVPTTTAPTTQAPHTHTYSAWKVAKAPTCTASGTEERTCACGAREARTIQAKGHTEITVKGKAATCADTGLTDGKKCAVCGVFTVKQATIATIAHKYVTTKAPNSDPYSADFASDGEKKCSVCGDTQAVKMTLPDVNSNEYARLLSQRMLYYINEYRVSEGAPKAQMLPNMTAYAEYRAVQLSTNFAHDAIDERRAATELKYGQYTVHNSELYTEEEIEALKTLGYYTITSDSVSFYSAPVGEACTQGIGWLPLNKCAEVATNTIHTSSGHWRYVGRATNVYISIGCYYNQADDTFYIDICTSDTDIYG